MGMAKCSGFYESYFGYFCGSYLDLALLDAASCLDIRVREALLEILEVEDVLRALKLLVLERSDIMAGQSTYFEKVGREEDAACLVIMVMVALLVLSLQDLDEEVPRDNSNCEAFMVWNYRWWVQSLHFIYSTNFT